mmetsp:Transcript_10873/g.25333  ORF Transcript_10873/g.25333 Transcript_10873/m.25333 type:complete len:503 (+) Transcript_10873:131-1639(+)|eukprot:CAMPEP_0201168962 /NCGR_PEP_ID=MMETSP0851-20130426/77863_1 /ASSEMBLY_ACC=CAM_ASM_000631 /TAXON_ID=183588 /ORGANISM="Pseudo-nitzschia fraudulenta, Strain WWA7" /LENGTH=502 /DNA_ID=CAMNT_0047450563 /DNA_START=72 /DNA_END=1580 /DNA_ORIENTATION=+
MKFLTVDLAFLAGVLALAEGSFLRDVAGKAKSPTNRQLLNEKLLEKAVPLDEYEKRIRTDGLYLPNDGSRRVENDNDDYENEDDYFVNANNYQNFTGYSFKYAKCQPVQRFSQNAVEAGEYSPMLVNDIVILRLCPSMYCSDSRAYGCNSDYVEYAIELTDYIRIMLRHEMDKEEQLCNWCDECGGGNRRNRGLASNYYYTYDEDGNVVLNEDYVPDSNLNCTDYESYCFDAYGNSECDDDNNANGNDDNYSIDLEGYLNILDCTQVNGGYFLRPRCDAYNGVLTMGVYHDKFCAHYAGNEVNVENFNLGINQTYFQQFGEDAGCQDCSESESPPYFTANSNLCNRLDVESARCTSSTSSELFVNNYTDSSSETDQCSFMESVRYGTYDAEGELYVDSTFGNSNRKVTTSQKWLLVLSMAICGVLAIYSCYLHHAITNLLIKSLSHTDLLPPSKYRRRNPNNNGNRRKGGRRGRKAYNNEVDEEDNDENFQANRNGLGIACA